jgi:hypothetical protein
MYSFSDNSNRTTCSFSSPGTETGGERNYGEENQTKNTLKNDHLYGYVGDNKQWYIGMSDSLLFILAPLYFLENIKLETDH